MQDRTPTPGQEGRVLITPEDGSAPFYAKIEMADNPTEAGTPFRKQTMLQDSTCKVLQLPTTATPNDAFLMTAIGIGNYAYRVKVLAQNGMPIPGANVSGLTQIFEGSLVTDENGEALGISTEESVTISVSSPYYNLDSVSDFLIQSEGIVTEATVFLQNKTGILEITSSVTIRWFENVNLIDLCAVSGGGGGGGGAAGSWGGSGGGGGGGYVENISINPNDYESIIFQIGAGGPAGKSSESGGTNYPTDGGDGGITVVSGTRKDTSTSTTLLRPVSGKGGLAGPPPNLGGTGGAGNGNGGSGGNGIYESGQNGVAGSGDIFNDPSLGPAGGGGGGGASGSDSTVRGLGGSPGGGNGASTKSTPYAATKGTKGGGGGGGVYYSVDPYNAIAAAGGDGIAYIRFHFNV